MITPDKKNPVVLALSAHDPAGAAGIQADIESINHYNCRCVSVITALTAQNTGQFDSVLPQNPVVFRKQADLLLSDIEIDACKIGLIGSELLIYEIAELVDDLGNIPVVLDPVLHSGSGTELVSTDIITALLENLLPRVTVLTPNFMEAIRLSGRPDPQDAAADLLSMGCSSVLITGADQSTKNVVNTLYMVDREPVEYNWDRLNGVYHGSGCTLAASIAAGLAMKKEIEPAVIDAQEYTYETLKRAIQLGKSQLHPGRHFKE